MVDTPKAVNQAFGHGAPHSATTGAIIVAHRPDNGFIDRVRRIQRQVAHVIVVDNSGRGDRKVNLYELARDGVEVVENERNLGVATALNQGFSRAIQLGLAWVVTLDQESEVDDDMLVQLGAVY